MQVRVQMGWWGKCILPKGVHSEGSLYAELLGQDARGYVLWRPIE